MENINFQNQNTQQINWGHFGVIMLMMVLVLGMSWMEKPDLFNFTKSSELLSTNQNVPHYYAYAAPVGDTRPEVLGANTNPGPNGINDNGSVSPVDAVQVLAAAT